ncbi:MAG: hypothetical protein OXC26_16350 [Albidovulum sp.]|nr:hypothetical protein [Albidovulum sp.]
MDAMIAGVLQSGLISADIGIKVASKGIFKKAAAPPKKPGRPKDWQDQIRVDLPAQVEAGATHYGIRSDGANIARTKDGDRIIPRSV